MRVGVRCSRQSSTTQPTSALPGVRMTSARHLVSGRFPSAKLGRMFSPCSPLKAAITPEEACVPGFCLGGKAGRVAWFDSVGAHRSRAKKEQLKTFKGD